VVGEAEIIFFFDNDSAGKEAVKKYAAMLHTEYPELKLTNVTPINKDVNDTLQAHDENIFTELLNNRQNAPLPPEGGETVSQSPSFGGVGEAVAAEAAIPPSGGLRGAVALDTSNPYRLKYASATAVYYVQGGLRKELDSLRVTLAIENPLLPHLKSRLKYDLYNDREVERNAKEAAEKLSLRSDLVQADICMLTDLLEAERERQLSESGAGEAVVTPERRMNEETRKKCLEFLRKPKLIEDINVLLGKAGVAGEESNRIFLFVVASSYLMKETMHALIQGSSGSGKTRLLKTVSAFIPEEDRFSFTRVTDNSFYNYPEYYLSGKLLCFEDFDGIREEAQLAVRELMSNGILVSSTSGKDESGNIHSRIRTVRGPVSTIACTTKGEIYEDNISRCFVIAVDESREQTERIIRYQNEVSAGLIDTRRQRALCVFLQNCMRLLQPCEVVNPYANKIALPPQAHKIRRLNELYQSFVRQLTLLNQYRRNKDAQGRLITEKEDLQTACEIMFESIVLKVDELDGSLRQFFEKLKVFVLDKGKDYEFNRFEVMEATGVKKTQEHYYLSRLTELEYIKQYGFKNRGFKYRIAYWDDIAALRSRLKESLNRQLEAL
jgi:energy-coupling factor transporter ATP-binding protein EcfA2